MNVRLPLSWKVLRHLWVLRRNAQRRLGRVRARAEASVPELGLALRAYLGPIPVGRTAL